MTTFNSKHNRAVWFDIPVADRNVDGRVRDAIAQVEKRGGSVKEPLHAIGPRGFRAVVLDSEGNRLALHSNTDA